MSLWSSDTVVNIIVVLEVESIRHNGLHDYEVGDGEHAVQVDLSEVHVKFASGPLLGIAIFDGCDAFSDEV